MSAQQDDAARPDPGKVELQPRERSASASRLIAKVLPPGELLRRLIEPQKVQLVKTHRPRTVHRAQVQTTLHRLHRLPGTLVREVFQSMVRLTRAVRAASVLNPEGVIR